MRDIAQAAGVSQSTVSRILNDAPTRVPIAAETRQRVTAAARLLGYRPNPLARRRRGAPTMLLGAVVRDLTDPVFASALEALPMGGRPRWTSRRTRGDLAPSRRAWPAARRPAVRAAGTAA
jgi:transcriptional regulator with XRE-family HTH domain